MRRFTDKFISGLKRKAQRYEVWQEGAGGFGVRVGPRGTKTFILLYHFGGRARRLTLGRYPMMSLADANIALGEARKLLERGEDPGKEAVAAREAERKAETVDDLTSEYIKHAKENMAPATAAEEERILTRYVLPRWRGRKAKSIRHREVVLLRKAIHERGARVMANRTLSCLRRLFDYAIAEAFIDASPCAAMKRLHKEKARERALSEPEIARAWHAIEAAGMEPNLKRVLKLLIATGQRRGEVLGLNEGELDCRVQRWTIPAARSKNRREHVVPLSPLALQIIGDPPKASEGSDQADRESARWIFPSGRTRAPYHGKAVDRAVRDLFKHRRQRKGAAPKTREAPPLADMAPWTPHDLRRSVATEMRRLCVSREVVGLVLNHAKPGITGQVYDRYEGVAEKRDALLRWGQRLEQIIVGEPAADPSPGGSAADDEATASNVVPLLVTARG